jgi:amidase
VDVRFPRWLLDAKGEFYTAVRYPEFTVQIADYLETLKPGFPRTLDEMIARAEKVMSTRADGSGPNPPRWNLFKRELASGSVDDYRYTAVRDHGLALVRATLEGVLSSNTLDAMIYPTSSRRPEVINAPPDTPGGGSASGSNLANLSGFPDLIVPAGFTTDRLPVGLSFVGPAFSEGRLIGLGYAFEQVTKARRRPAHTPALPGETLATSSASRR